MNRHSMTMLGLAILAGFLFSSAKGISVQGEPVKLTEEKEGFIYPVWSPDGQFIAVTRGDWRGIWRISSDGKQLEELTADRGAGYKFAWSPEGRHIVYRVEKMVDGKRHFAIMVVDVEDKTLHTITEFERYLGVPRWVSADGTIAFETDRDGSLAMAKTAHLFPSETQRELSNLVATTSGNLQIWISQPDGSERTLISGPEERCFDPIPSPDGRRVCYSSLDAGGSIVVAQADGEGKVNLGYGSSPCWSPDGSKLVYEVTEDDGTLITGSDLFLIGVDDSDKVRLTDTPDLIERWPKWSPDGTKIAFCAGEAIYVLPIQQPTTLGE